MLAPPSNWRTTGGACTFDVAAEATINSHAGRKNTPIDSAPRSVSSPSSAVQELQRIVIANRTQLAPYLQCLATASVHETVGARYRTLHHDICQLLAGIIAEQAAAGTLPPWIDPEAMAQLIVAVVNGVAAAAAIDPANTDPPAIGTHLVSLLLAVRSP